MYQLVTTTTPTARLTEGGSRRWGQKGQLAARFRVLVKRRLRRRCLEVSAKAWRVEDVTGVIVEQGVM